MYSKYCLLVTKVYRLLGCKSAEMQPTRRVPYVVAEFFSVGLTCVAGMCSQLAPLLTLRFN